MLLGRPYGGCAILWNSLLLANVCPLVINCRRVCAIRASFDTYKVLFINVYMPYEDRVKNDAEFFDILSVIDAVISDHADCHIVLGGDFNVDFNRNWSHSVLLSSFCEAVSLYPTVWHAMSAIDYSFDFNMLRFSILDHFILSGALFDDCVLSVAVKHDPDNLSDHDPIMLHLNLVSKFLAMDKRIFKPSLSWVKSSANDKIEYRTVLSTFLRNIDLPAAALLCTDMCCKDVSHHNAIGDYADTISNACSSAAESTLQTVMSA